MRKIFQTLLLLIASVSGFAADVRFDSSFLDKLPSLRAQAVAKSKASDSDSTSDIQSKKEVYYSALKQIIQGIRSRYYFHTDFPDNLCTALEQHAVVLAGIEYPLSNVTGASSYDALVTNTKIRLAEEMICRMSKFTYDEALRNKKTDKATKRSAGGYREWLKKWNINGPS